MEYVCSKKGLLESRTKLCEAKKYQMLYWCFIVLPDIGTHCHNCIQHQTFAGENLNKLEAICKPVELTFSFSEQIHIKSWQSKCAEIITWGWNNPHVKSCDMVKVAAFDMTVLVKIMNSESKLQAIQESAVWRSTVCITWWF